MEPALAGSLPPGAAAAPKPVANVIGGGPCGSVCAMILLDAGFEVDVYELREPPLLEENDATAETGAGSDNTENTAERGPDNNTSVSSKVMSATKRSINLALSLRGIRALERVGAADAVLARATEMHSRFVHLRDGSTARQRYGAPGEAIYSVSRPEAVKTLAKLAKKRGARFFYGEKCVGISRDAGAPLFASGRVARRGAVFGCDGAFSATRRALERLGRFETRVWYAKQGYKELSVPPVSSSSSSSKSATTPPVVVEEDNNTDDDGTTTPTKPATTRAFPANYLHIWPRGETMLVALPNLDGSFTATLFAPIEALEAMEATWSRDRVAAYFRDEFPDAFAAMGETGLVDDFFANPASPLVQVTVAPWHLDDPPALLLGDASHAVVPFYGQGMNAALEDCLALAEIFDAQRTNNSGQETTTIEAEQTTSTSSSSSEDTVMLESTSTTTTPIDLRAAFAEVSRKRRLAADGLSTLATMNYKDMAENTASTTYRARKAVEGCVARYCGPALWMPLYSMVTFSRIPYDQVLSRHQTQERRLTFLCAGLATAAAGLLGLGATAVFRRLSSVSALGARPPL